MSELNDEELGPGLSEQPLPPEYSPDKRFSRKPKLIAEGKYKKVFLGYDHEIGREVAWSSINLSSFSSSNKERIIADLQVFNQIDHPSFLKVFKSWSDSSRMELVIITELTTCSLKQFVRNKLKVMRAKVVKVWIRDVLRGLQYCHGKGIVHRSVRLENLFISAADSSVRIGLFNSLDQKRAVNRGFDLKSLAFVVTEVCGKVDLNYASLNRKSPPREVEMILNERVKEWVKFCFGEESVEMVMAHAFISSDDPSDSAAIEVRAIEDYFEVSVEALTSLDKCWVIINKNDKLLCKIEFNHSEDVAESVADRIVNEHRLPEKFFFEIIEQIENCFSTSHARNLFEDHKNITKIPEDTKNVAEDYKNRKNLAEDNKPTKNADYYNKNAKNVEEFNKSFQDFPPAPILSHFRASSFQDITPISVVSNHFSFTSELKVPKKLSLNLEIKDVSHCKKIKIDLEYDPELDSPRLIAQQIVSKFSLDQSELTTISRLITDKLAGSESETYSNYSNQDLLDFTEDIHLFKPCLNSTNEYSVASETPSLRSSYEPPNDLHKGKEDYEPKVVCGKGHKNDPKEVKKLQEALTVVMGVRLTIDGVFSVGTEMSVKKFQEENGFTPTGVVSERLWDSIMIRAKFCRND